LKRKKRDSWTRKGRKGGAVQVDDKRKRRQKKKKTLR